MNQPVTFQVNGTLTLGASCVGWILNRLQYRFPREGECARNDLAAFLDLVEAKASHYEQRRQERLAGAGAPSGR
jgi:hypothetical protein